MKKHKKKVDTWIREIGGGYFSELTNLGVLMEEVGELARWIVRQYGDQNRKQAEKETNAREAIEDELTDILWVLICLANQMEIDLTSALQKNIQKKTIRDLHRHKKN